LIHFAHTHNDAIHASTKVDSLFLTFIWEMGFFELPKNFLWEEIRNFLKEIFMG